MNYEIGNKQNKSILDGIEEIDKETEAAIKKNIPVDDLSFLDIAVNKDVNFLEGIENIN